MIVGDVPEEQDDAEGFIFSGAAGQLLDKILHAIALGRHNVYLCNLVKCRTPDGREPIAAESRSCMPYLSKQIELIDPAFILVLGAAAARALLNVEDSLQELRGNVLKVGNAQVIVTWHPQQLLAQPHLKRQTLEDVQLLKEHYDAWKKIEK